MTNAFLTLFCCLLAVGALAWEPVSLRRRAILTQGSTSETAVIPAATTARYLKSAKEGLTDRTEDISESYWWWRNPKKEKQPKAEKTKTPPGQLRKADSASKKKLKGILHVIVMGKKDTCFVKVIQKDIPKSEQFGDTTSTETFMDLYGHAECERKLMQSQVIHESGFAAGAKGVSHGFVKATVVAEAHQLGDECESRVLADVSSRTKDVKKDDGVQAIVESAVGGDALADCDQSVLY